MSSATVEGSIFEDTGAMSLSLGSGMASIKNNEWRANNRLTYAELDFANGKAAAQPAARQLIQARREFGDFRVRLRGRRPA